MIPFDITEIIRETEIGLRSSSIWRVLINSHTNLAVMMEDLTVGVVWGNCIDKLKEVTNDVSSSLVAEKVVSKLIKIGVSRDKINYHDDVYRVHLDNNSYFIHRHPTGIAIQPFTSYVNYKPTYSCVDPDLLVNLILLFDATMPEIKQAGRRLFTHYKKEEIENEIMSIVCEARERKTDAVIPLETDTSELLVIY